MYPIRQLRRSALVGGGAVVVALVGTMANAGSADAAAPSALVSGHCTARSTTSLQVQHSEPGKIEAGFEVDHARVGSQWKVRLTHNGVSYFVGRRIARASGGTFSVDRVLPDLAGGDRITARARNLATGEVCTVAGTI